MAFSDLTPEQQAVLAEHVRMVRAWAGEQARTNNHAQTLATNYWSQANAILALLDDADVITDGSGLAGAGVLTKTDVVALTSYIEGITTGYDTAPHRQMYAKAAGPGNLIG